MSAALEEFKELMEQSAKNQVPIQTEWCIVNEVDWDAKTMTATSLINGLAYFDILLGLGSEFKKPVKETKVLVGIIANNKGCFLIAANEVEKVQITVKDCEFVIDESGFLIKNQDETLKGLMNDMIDELNKIIVVNGTTINVAAMNIIKQRLNTVLTD